ncbi:MAG: hypothetical protein R3182_09835 [Draconibacterium sp.]|nr:hypothetical protein [Draconibacterium sp.]
MKKVLLIVGITILVLALPLIFNSKEKRKLVGPDLSEFTYKEVFFQNEKEDIKLAGMLFIPEVEEEIPVVSIIHGSGPSRRNSVWYLSVTKHLLENGIAVLLPDKRGCEKSEGNWRGASLEELANDALATVDFLKNKD